MEPIPVPDEAKRARGYCQLVSMGPPPGVSDDDCGTVEMLIAPPGSSGVAGIARGQYAYYRPTDADLAILNRGGFIEVAQYGNVVQPFSAAILPADGDPATERSDEELLADAMGYLYVHAPARRDEIKAWSERTGLGITVDV